MTTIDVLERQAARVQRLGMEDLFLSAPLLPNGTPECEDSGDLVSRETLERGMAYLRENSEARKRAVSVLGEPLSRCPDRLKPQELLRQFEALLDIYAGSSLDQWREKWATRVAA